ncbi:MAG: outer membrane protein TolC [Alphaproteobacteria bacterium]|jgi:outer membrane protein TolC
MQPKLLLFVLAAGLSGCAVSTTPLSVDEISDYAGDKRSRVTTDQEPVSGPVSLYEAMARALKYNLDKRVELMNVALAKRQVSLAHHEGLPRLVADSGYTKRNNYSGGNSVSIIGKDETGAQSLRSSTSSEREVKTGDLAFSWHILDFGLSYIRAQQAADKVLIANEQKRKVINRIVEGVRTAYWKAVTASRLLGRLRSLERRVQGAMRDTQALARKADTSPLTALTYERELVEIQREVRRLHGDLAVAKSQLASLMNVDPGANFSVIMPSHFHQPKRIGMNVGDMISTALENRSELREVAYKERINKKEAEAAIVEMLPGISFDAAPNWSSNQFLYNSHWVSWGAKASWNLMKVFTYRDREAAIIAQDELLDQRALAVTMAIMTQVHVSRVRLIHARRKYRSAKHYYDVQRRILGQIRSSLAQEKVSEQTAIREEMNTLVARVKLDVAFTELQTAHANVYSSMGTDPYAPLVDEDLDLRSLAVALKTGWRTLVIASH